MGHSSSAGFWIPKKAMEMKAVARPAPASRKRKSSSTGFGRGRPSGGPRGRPSKPAVQEVLEEIADSDSGMPQAPEEVPVSRSRNSNGAHKCPDIQSLPLSFRHLDTPYFAALTLQGNMPASQFE